MIAITYLVIGLGNQVPPMPSNHCSRQRIDRWTFARAIVPQGNHNMIRDDHLRLGAFLALAAIGTLAPLAAAQSGNDNNYNNRPVITPSQPVRQRAPSRVQGLGGVRSQPGVKSQAPAPISVPMFGNPLPPAIAAPGSSNPAILAPTQTIGPRIGPARDFILGDRDGVTFSGSFQDGPFRIKFSTSGAGRVISDRFFVPVYTGGYRALVPYGGVGTCFINDTPIVSYYGPRPAPTVEPPAMTEDAAKAPPAPLTADERAALRLKTGDSAGAIKAYEAILKQRPSDADAMRLLGMALIDNGRASDGIAVIGMAYRTDSSLPQRPLNPEVLQNGTARLRQHLNRVSAIANKEKSGTAWFVLATLMQAEGRNKQALAMVERARAAGVDGQVADELAAALNDGGSH